MSKFTIGTDSEFFLVSKLDGRYVSAIPIIKGTKWEPEVLENKAGLQHDNVAMEFATPIAGNLSELLSHIRSTFRLVKQKLPENIVYCGTSSTSFPHEELKDPEAHVMGCDPDYNAWEDGAMNKITKLHDKTFRSCGGHIHVGYVPNSGNDFLLTDTGKLRLIKVMDALHGVVSVVIDNNIPSIKRRFLYGKAGAYRPTDYGVEYRVLSNFWVKSPVLVSLMYHLTKEALNIVRLNQDEELIKAMGGYAQIGSTINNGLARGATLLINNHIMPRVDKATYSLLKKSNTFHFNKAIDQAWGLA